MRFAVFHFAIRVLRWIALFSLIVLLILWAFDSLYLFTLILVYEALVILALGAFQILGTYIYRSNSTHSGMHWAGQGSRTGWFNFKKFADLKPEERKRFRQEGKIMIIISIMLLVVTIIIHFSIT